MFVGYTGTKVGTGTYSFFSYGIFTPLASYGVNTSVILLLSMTTGVLFVVAFVLYLKGVKPVSEDIVALYAIAATASIFWCYKTPCDEIIMISCNILGIYAWKYCRKTKANAVGLLLYFAAMNMKIFRMYGRKISGLSYFNSLVLDMILRIVALGILMWIIKKKWKAVEEKT